MNCAANSGDDRYRRPFALPCEHTIACTVVNIQDKLSDCNTCYPRLPLLPFGPDGRQNRPCSRSAALCTIGTECMLLATG